MRRRGEVLERSFAHCYETGGMRRTHLRGRGNILKRLVIHACGFNLGLVMRSVLGAGKPRQLADRARAAASALILVVLRALTSLPIPMGADPLSLALAPAIAARPAGFRGIIIRH